MNWIFEIYGDTYKAITLQDQGKRAPSRSDDRGPYLPILHPFGFLLKR